MELVKNIEQFEELYLECRNKFKKLDRNNFFLKRICVQFIEEERLYYEWYSKGIVFFVDEDSYYNAYFLWDSKESEMNICQDKPILVEEILTEKDVQINNFSCRERLLKAGFTQEKKNYQLEVNLQKNKDTLLSGFDEKMKELNERNWKWMICNNEKYEKQIINLWKTTFSAIEIPLTHYEFMKDTVSDAICIINEDDMVIGACWYTSDGHGNSEARHVVTHPDFYQQGIGRLITMLYFNEAIKRGDINMFGWVEEKNIRSRIVHEKLGYHLNGRCSIQYYFNRTRGAVAK